METPSVLVISVLLSLAIALPSSTALAQQKQQVSFASPAENSKYTQQLTVAVGDVPGHNVRVYEIHHTYHDNAPVIGGLKLVEEWDRGSSDLTGGNGTGTTYNVYVMENGDRFAARINAIVQRKSGAAIATGVGAITGGTGRFAEIQGTVQFSAHPNGRAGVAESQTEIEYSIGKSTDTK
jgi:hypothetical protein